MNIKQYLHTALDKSYILRRTDQIESMLVYLMDWKHTLLHGKRFLGGKWMFTHLGTENEYVQTYLINNEVSDLPQNEREVLDFVVNAITDDSYADLVKLVYSTRPMMSTLRYNELDLLKYAKEQNNG